MYLLIILLLINYVRTQQDLCSCSCCTGQSCIPSFIGAFYMPSCTTETCRLYCRQSYPQQCPSIDLNGQVLPLCSSNTSTIPPLYNCRCDCCKSNFATCTPFFVGYSTAYICDSSACSISCSAQYPDQCRSSDRPAQTNGTCVSPITTTSTTVLTTTTSTVTGSWLGNNCLCMCCQSGPDCSPNIQVGTTTAPQCSLSACTAACQTQYPAACPSLAYLGKTNGTCTNQNNGRTRCQCQCCGTNGCPSYDIYTNEDCASCAVLCPQQSPCGNTNVTFSCNSSASTKSMQFPILLIIYISIYVLPFYSIF